MPKTRLLIPLLLVVSTVAWVAATRGSTPPLPVVPPRGDVVLSADTMTLQGVVPANSTLDGLLRASGVGADAVQRLITAARPLFDPRRLQAAHPFALVRTVAGALRSFEYEIDGDWLLRITETDVALPAPRAELVPIPKTLEEAVVSGTIGGATPSLFQAMDAAGERAELSIALAEVFAGEIDFNTELQPDDRFVVAFERFVRDGRPASYGAISAAEFRNNGRVFRAVRFTPPGGKPDYFDEQGRSVHRFFLRSPLKFEPRVTSRFSTSRMHPVLHTERAHRGVDYAAPTGAPVVAVSPGTVISATVDRTNGRMIRLRHASGYESAYLHLSAFAVGIRAGAAVTQGQLIGLVGATGLATGPHLHYALRKNGTFVDPLREQRNLPPGDPVPASALDAYRQVRDKALARLVAPSAAPGVLSASN